MSDEPEARMWDDDRSSRYDGLGRGAYYESAFASSEQLDRAPLLADEPYSDVPVLPPGPEEHCHWRAQAEPPSAVPKLIAALVLCGFFMICEVIGGYLAGSLSVMCDAAHMLSDCGGFALALLAFHCAKRPPDAHMSYGYKRAEVLGAMVSVLMIWLLTGIFVYLAALRLHTGDFSIKPDAMMIVSGCGLAFNVVLALVLHGCGSDIAHAHSHGGPSSQHGHSHDLPRFTFFKRREKHSNGTLINGDYSMKEFATAESGAEGAQSRNINLRAALIHVIGDLIQSCGVLLASILIKIYPSAKLVDPLCTFVFSILVLCTSARVVRDALAILMQGVPAGFKYSIALSQLSSVRGVRGVHSLRVWALSTHHTVLSAHLAIDSLCDPEAVLRESQLIARTQLRVQDATFQVERYTSAMSSCATCSSQPGETA